MGWSAICEAEPVFLVKVARQVLLTLHGLVIGPGGCYAETGVWNYVSEKPKRKMENRILGVGLSVSAVGLGCMGMSHAYGLPADKREMAALLTEAVEMGYMFFDTAEVYGTPDRPHDNEELLGEALRPFRGWIVLAPKFGLSFDRPEAPGIHALIPDPRPAVICRSLKGMLHRLHTDCLDLYYQHRIDPRVEPEEVAGTMADLIHEGKIRHWGISEATEDYLRRAHRSVPSRPCRTAIR